MPPADAEPITSPHNPQVRLARALLAAAGRRRHRAFLVEGLRLVEAAADATRPRLVLHTPDFGRTDARQRGLLRRLRAAGVPLRPVAPRVLAQVTDTVTPQGIVAVVSLPEDDRRPPPAARRPACEPSSRPLGPVAGPGTLGGGRRSAGGAGGAEEPAPLALVLDAIGDPGNAGTLLRSAAAAGVTRVLATTGTVDCYAPKVVRAGAGAHFCLPLLADCSWELVRQTLPAPCQVLLADARAATAYWDVDWTRPSALIVSNEAHGASAAARALAAAAIAIPMRRTESLNVAVAGSIILFEALRQRAGRWPVASGQWPAGHAPR